VGSLTLASIATYKEVDSKRPKKKFEKTFLVAKTFDTINKQGQVKTINIQEKYFTSHNHTIPGIQYPHDKRSLLKKIKF